MITIGLTGGIGSGKSYVAQILQGEFQIPVYDSDTRAKALMLTDAIRKPLIETFGPDTYLPDGALNRNYIAQLVFQNPDKLAQLNAIVHPIVRVDRDTWFAEQAHNGHRYCVQEAAILIESGAYTTLDCIWTVYAPLHIRIQRAMQRDQLPESAIVARIQNQITDLDRFKHSNIVIHNYNEISILEQLKIILQ